MKLASPCSIIEYASFCKRKWGKLCIFMMGLVGFKRSKPRCGCQDLIGQEPDKNFDQTGHFHNYVMMGIFT